MARSDGVAKCYVFLRFLKHSNLLWLQWKSLRLQWRGPTVWPNATFSCGFLLHSNLLRLQWKGLRFPPFLQTSPVSVQIWIKLFSSPDTPSQSYCKFASKWLHFNTFLSRSGSDHFRAREPFPKLCQIWSILLHLDTFLSRSGPNHFRARRANPKAHVLFVQNEKNASILSLKLYKIMSFMCSQWKECVYFVSL